MFPHPRVHTGSSLHLEAVVHTLLCIITEVLKEGLVVTLEVGFLNEYTALSEILWWQ